MTRAAGPTRIDPLATAVVRARAAELGVDLVRVPGTGVAQRVTLRDVCRAAGVDWPDASAERASADQLLTHAKERRSDNVLASSAVRRLAAARGIDLTRLEGSGPGGRIRPQDLPSPSTTTDARRCTHERLTAERRAVARERVATLQESAQLTTVVEADVSDVVTAAADTPWGAAHPGTAAILPHVAVAIGRLLPAHPVINATIDREAEVVHYHDHEHLAVTMHARSGSSTVLVLDAGARSVDEVAGLLAGAADQGAPKVAHERATFALTVAGDGVLFDTPLLPRGLSAVLSVGTPVRRAVASDECELGDAIAVRHVAHLALTYDHRLVDGADAARFLGALAACLRRSA
jgi:2-oxoglutarate dehydrogenase E2 component (dihydrolipoamide succinyltransferase)